MSSENPPRPTDAELQILQVLWEQGPSTVREVQSTLERERTVGYTTVLKLMQIMAEKGLVERDETERAHVYALGQIGFSYVQLHSDQYGFGGGCDSYYGCGGGYGYGNVYSATHLSWNAGVGVEFPLYWGQSWFIEAQYRQIETPTPIETAQKTAAKKKTAKKQVAA